MKISQNQKEENRKKIIRETVELILEKGYKSTTMRAIAKASNIGDATIYSYFPTKESILYGYYEDAMQNCIERLRAIEKFNEFTLQEQLQKFFEVQFEIFLPDREFVQQTFRQIFFSFGQDIKRISRIRELFLNIVEDILSAAEEIGEIPEHPFQDMIYLAFWDYNIALVMYWLNDTSDFFSDTTLFNDKSIDLACALLQSDIINKTVGMATFLFRNHVLDRMHDIKSRMKIVDVIKREFTGGSHVGKNTSK